MILNTGNLKSPFVFWLYLCRSFRQARQSNKPWKNRIGHFERLVVHFAANRGSASTAWSHIRFCSTRVSYRSQYSIRAPNLLTSITQATEMIIPATQPTIA